MLVLERVLRSVFTEGLVMKGLIRLLAVSISSIGLGCSAAYAVPAQCPEQLTVQGITAIDSKFETSQDELNAIAGASNIQFHFVYIDDGGIAHCAYSSSAGLIDVNLKAVDSKAKSPSQMSGDKLLLGASNNWQGIQCGGTSSEQCQFDIPG